VVKIRLRRIGAKKRPFYRIVAADCRCARDGRFIELLGTYDPNQDPPEIKLQRDRIQYWLDNGARPSDTARGLLKSQGFLGAEAKQEPKPKKAAKAVVAEPKAAKVEVEAAVVEAPAEEAVAAVEEAKPEAEVKEKKPKAAKPKADTDKTEKPKAAKPKAETEKAEKPKAAKPKAETEKAEKPKAAKPKVEKAKPEEKAE